jgi:hypothetical protein
VADLADLAVNFLALAGGTMTGPLTLPAQDPSEIKPGSNRAATVGLLWEIAENVNALGAQNVVELQLVADALGVLINAKLPLAGGTMTGPLTLPAQDPSEIKPGSNRAATLGLLWEIAENVNALGAQNVVELQLVVDALGALINARLALAGGTMTGAVTFPAGGPMIEIGNTFIGADGTGGRLTLASKDGLSFLTVGGGEITITGDFRTAGSRTPKRDDSFTTKEYVDSAINAAAPIAKEDAPLAFGTTNSQVTLPTLWMDPIGNVGDNYYSMVPVGFVPITVNGTEYLMPFYNQAPAGSKPGDVISVPQPKA